MIIRVSRYQKGKTNLDFTEARDSEWQWHQLGHMQVCTSLQSDNHTSTRPLSFYRPDALPAAQPTASNNWRQYAPPKKNNYATGISLRENSSQALFYRFIFIVVLVRTGGQLSKLLAAVQFIVHFSRLSKIYRCLYDNISLKLLIFSNTIVRNCMQIVTIITARTVNSLPISWIYRL